MKLKIKLSGDKELNKEIKRLNKEIPNELRDLILSVAIVDIESYMKENEIPVDTGRLRASIHTKYIKNITHSYSDNTGNVFNGTLNEKIDINSIVVGTNVEYAQKLNREGGGGVNSGRTVGGVKRNKGYGKNFFDKAWAHGKKVLQDELQNFAKRINKI